MWYRGSLDFVNSISFETSPSIPLGSERISAASRSFVLKDAPWKVSKDRNMYNIHAVLTSYLRNHWRTQHRSACVNHYETTLAQGRDAMLGCITIPTVLVIESLTFSFLFFFWQKHIYIYISQTKWTSCCGPDLDGVTLFGGAGLDRHPLREEGAL